MVSFPPGTPPLIVILHRDFVTAELRSNQAKIKNRLNEMQSKLDVLTARANEMEEKVNSEAQL